MDETNREQEWTEEELLQFNDDLKDPSVDSDASPMSGEAAVRYSPPFDPKPYVHSCWDDGTCSRIGERVEVRGINDEFSPRNGYEKDEQKYRVTS